MTRIAQSWDPWGELEQLRNEVNRVFSDWTQPAARRQVEFPAVNVWHDDHSLLLTAEVPGVSGDELDVTVTGTSVTIRGRRSERPLNKGENYFRHERWADPFSRTIELPFEVDAQKTEAAYEQGVLSLKLHRPEEHKPKKITIKAK